MLKNGPIFEVFSGPENHKYLKYGASSIFPSWTSQVRSPSPALVLKSFAPPRFPPFPIVSACDELRPAKLLWSPKVSLKACVLFESDMVQNLARALGSGPRGLRFESTRFDSMTSPLEIPKG